MVVELRWDVFARTLHPVFEPFLVFRIARKMLFPTMLMQMTILSVFVSA